MTTPHLTPQMLELVGILAPSITSVLVALITVRRRRRPPGATRGRSR